jgi:hypothetical protein
MNKKIIGQLAFSVFYTLVIIGALYLIAWWFTGLPSEDW